MLLAKRLQDRVQYRWPIALILLVMLFLTYVIYAACQQTLWTSDNPIKSGQLALPYVKSVKHIRAV